MMSGGIDSPVASFLAIKKGVLVSAIHYASPPYTSQMALQKVIDLLEQVPTYIAENNDNSEEINDKMQDSAIKVDLISRQEVLDSLNYYELEDVIDEQDFGYNHAIQTIRDDVMTMKTYSVKEETAELYWLQYDANPRIGNWHCTKCNMIVSENDPNYCPNCGAKMKGDTE